jgi:hypothetical protein
MMTRTEDRSNLTAPAGINIIGKMDQMDENIFRPSQTPNRKESVKNQKTIVSKILVEKSGKYGNKTNQSSAIQNDEEENNSMVSQHKKEVSLLQRLKVFQASRSDRISVPEKPFPTEVIVENDGDDDVPGAATVFSELGVDGLLSASTVEKQTPTRFTFDGIVPSKSSLDEIDVPPGYTVPTRDFHHEEVAAPAILEGLEYEIDDESEPDAVGDDELMKILSQYDTGRKERCRSASTELSIELSESQYLRNCEAAAEDKFKIFSPQSSFGSEGNQFPIDHGFNHVILQHQNEEKAKEESASSPWIGFSFLGLW